MVIVVMPVLAAVMFVVMAKLKLGNTLGGYRCSSNRDHSLPLYGA